MGGLVLIVPTPGHQAFLCAARSSDPRSLSLSLSISSILPLSVATDLSPTMVCTNTASQIRFVQTHRRKRQHRNTQKFISSRLAALIRSALSLLWAQRKGWKIESFRRSKQTRAANYTCSPLALPLLAETLIGLTSQFTAILVSFLSDSSRSCKKTPALSAWKRKFIQPKQR